MEFKKEENIQNLKDVWEKGNNISIPNKKIKHSEKIKNQVANFFSAGEFYYYIFNFETLKMEYVSKSVEQVLGIKLEKFSLEKLLSFYHPDDIEKMKEKELAALEFKLNRIEPDQITDYKTVYLLRFLLADGSVKKILHQAKAINISKNGKIQQVLGVHTDLSYLNIPIDHKISFISEKYPSYYSLDPTNLVLEKINKKSTFSSQEIKIITLIAQGKTNAEIGKTLFIAETTVKTHRKNILSKGNTVNTPHLIANCIREGLI